MKRNDLLHDMRRLAQLAMSFHASAIEFNEKVEELYYTLSKAGLLEEDE